MHHTFHAQERLRQRNIPPEIIDLVIEWGSPVSNSLDRVILVKAAAQQLPVSKPLRLRIEKQLPIVCVTDGVSLITAYRPTRRIGHTKGKR